MALKSAKLSRCDPLNGILFQTLDYFFSKANIFFSFSSLPSINFCSKASVFFVTELRAKLNSFSFQRKTKKKNKRLEIMAQSLKLQGVGDEMQKLLDANMDEAPARRRAREAFKDIQLGIDHILFKSYEVNSRGLKIFSKSWLPETSSPKAIVCFCHGYENPEFHSLPSFLFGQSMGGAVTLKMHLKQPNAWTGAVLVAPMCKIADDMVPPLLLKQILIGLAKIFPKMKLVPQKDLAEAAFRDLKKREMTAYNVIAYKDKPRLRTALEMLKTTQEIERWLEQVSLPLLILHGEADIVTDASVSKALYDKASSLDKKLNLYKDAYHSLLEGEPDEMIIRVFNDIVSWLDEHSAKSVGS
ncbi:hypothetical protein L484_001190 [Morus notabilis]|uniref:Serine aminopeptidase S33 domain-containing protein n=1 Tax=Morus notabilis TaxID=981085 RepID=W9T2U3_9ROSA|nr:hypothetical protein L484_001190 [Morus notabilis]